ncbi:unnamed protein product [Urochloa humidicola]
MDKWRRYVCLAVNQFGYGTYPLRRIDASSLFYPTNPTKVCHLMNLVCLTPASASALRTPALGRKASISLAFSALARRKPFWLP